MAKKKLTKSSGNFVKRTLNTKLGDGSSIYEVDYSTLSGLDLGVGEQPVYSEGNFKIVTNPEVDTSKKYGTGDWIESPSSDDFWTLDELDVSEEKLTSINSIKPSIKLNIDYNLLSSFAYYGSLTELIKSSIEDIIVRFPASLWVRPMTTSGVRYDLVNLFDIDLFTSSTLSDDDLKVMISRFKDYEIVETIYEYYMLPCGSVEYKENTLTSHTYGITSFIQEFKYLNSNGEIVYTKPTSGRYEQLLNKITFNGVDIDNNNISIVLDYVYNPINPCEITHIYTSVVGVTNSVDNPNFPQTSYHIKPKNEIVESFFESLDDFQSILLNRTTNPRYVSIFKIPQEDEEFGVYYIDKKFTWMTPDGWNLDVESLEYSSYINDILEAATYIDNYKSDNIIRMLTHETIKNMESRNILVGSTVDTDAINKIISMLRLYGRVYDEIKKYVDSLSFVNNITYDNKNNLPSIFFRQFLSTNLGWDVTSLITKDNEKNDVLSPNLYFGYRKGFNINETESEFFKRLILSTKYILKSKGTKKSVEYIMNLFGIDRDKWSIKEYAYKIDNILSKSDVEAIIDLNKTRNYTLNGVVYNEFQNEEEEFEGFINDGLEYLCLGKLYNDDYVTCPTCNGSGITINSIGNVICPTCSGLGYVRDYVGVPEFKGNSDILYYQQKGEWYQETSRNLNMVNTLTELYGINKSKLNLGSLYYVDTINENFSSNYFVLVDMDNFNNENGWDNIPSDKFDGYEAKNSNGDIVAVININVLLSIKDNNKGNNPHYGGSEYDNGIDYLKHFGYEIDGVTYDNGGLFKYVIDNAPECIKNENQYLNLLQKGFKITEYLDTKKSWGVNNDIVKIDKTYNIKPRTWTEDCSNRTMIFKDGNNIREVNQDPIEYYKIINTKRVTLTFNGNDNEVNEFESIILPYIEQVIPSTILFNLVLNRI